MDLEKINEFRQQQAQQAADAKQQSNHDELAGTLNNLLLATMVSKDPKMVEVAKNLADLLQSIASASDNFQNSSLNLLPMANAELAESVRTLAEKVEQHSSQTDLEAHFRQLSSLLMRVADVKPIVNVPTQPVSVDLKPLLAGLKDLQKEVKSSKVDIPKNDLSGVIKGLKAVQDKISGLRFPVPNYVLPFKNTQNAATQVQLDADGKVPVAATFTPSGTQDTNIVEIGGNAVTTTIPVSGTVNAAQSGTWTVQPGNTANTTAWKVDGSAVTQPVSGTFWQATQPVSGTVTSNAGTGTFSTKETRSATGTVSSVADTASSTTLLASNAARLGATIHNDSTVALYVKLGATASTSSFTVKMAADSYYEVPFGYTGVIDGIWASDASGSARVTELT